METANEIHVPVGVPIRFRGTSRDVIHSFWAPNVNGKRDLLPGYETEVIWQVDQPGRWRVVPIDGRRLFMAKVSVLLSVIAILLVIAGTLAVATLHPFD